MTVASTTETRALYDLLQVPELCDVDAKAIIAELAWHLAEQVRIELSSASHNNILLVPILRGGLLLYPAFAGTFGASAVGLLQISRNGHERRVTYECLPPRARADFVLYLDAVAGTGRTIKCASQLLRERYETQHHYACVLASAGDATKYIHESNVSVIGVSTDERNLDGLVVPDLGTRDAGDLASSPKGSPPKTPDFPIVDFERFHDSDKRARRLRSDLIYRPTIDLVRRHCPKAILDIGCGSGGLTEKLARFATDVVGYDPSLEAIALAKHRSQARNIHYTSTLSREMAGAFDFIACCMVLNSTANFEGVIQVAASCSARRSLQAWTILHPAFQFNESQWRARKVVSSSNLAMSFSLVPSYFEEHAFDKQVGQVTLTEHHRPLSKYLRSIRRHGFLISDLVEPQANTLDQDIVERFIPRTLVIITEKTGE
jgi:uracil phosphoribosyltransferase/SAM-dependent methyltransferase